ncbi:9853_t:CDS:1, partial [Ambispora leptoticha]
MIKKTTDNEIIKDDETVDNNDNDIFFAINEKIIASAHKIAIEKSASEDENEELLEILNDIDELLFEVRTEFTFSAESDKQIVLPLNTDK